jgi:glycosyltransferase involved in cell wall biosynthesis
VIEQLQRQLAMAERRLASLGRRQQWLERALATQRHARQVLEAAVSASYTETTARIRDIVETTIPPAAVVLVVSKGDEELLKLGQRPAWHFPRADDGAYAGHYPADSGAAIEHLQALVAKGAEFLLLPSTAYWWLEHYRELEAHLGRQHERIWRDERCIIYRLRRSARLGPERAAAQPAGDRPRRVSSIVPPAVPGHYDLVCFPIIDWAYRFQRPQQLMQQFAAAGHRVFYLSHRFHKSGEPYAVRPQAQNLWEISLRGARFNPHGGVLDAESRQLLLGSLDTLRVEQSIGVAAAIVQGPFWWPLVKAAAAGFGWPVVYDCLDHHPGFATSHPLTEEQEQELLSEANLVVASSAGLRRKARRHNRHVRLVRNGCDYERFAQVPDRAPGPRPVVGYYGAIAEWFDSELVAALAERRPDWDFVLVGSTLRGEVERLCKLPNVSLAGEQPYAAIPDWLAAFDVALLPFKRNPLTQATNPVKLYEILAAGKPLVSVPLPEVVPLVPLVRVASTARGFERAIEVELGQRDASRRSTRRAFAKENTWRKRFEELAPAIFELFPSPAAHARRVSGDSGKRRTPRSRSGGEEANDV